MICPDCGAFFTPADGGCECWVSEAEARDEAVRADRCLVCSGFSAAKGERLCLRHEQEHAERRREVAKALRVYRNEGHVEAVRALRNEAKTLDRRAS